MGREKTKRSGMSTFGLDEALDTPPAAEEPTPAPQPVAPVAEPTAPEPEAEPVVRTPAPTRKSTVTRPPTAATRRTPPPAAPDRGVAALEGRHPQGGGGATPSAPHPEAREVNADYFTPAWHPREKDPTAATSTDLIDEMVAVQAEWTAANRSRLSGRSQPPPTNSGFREALLRLGLKHLNDPEFIELIPPDARRKQRK